MNDVNWAEREHQSPNLGNPTGTVAVGDMVICRGTYVPITAIVVHEPGTRLQHVTAGYWAIEVRTPNGSRWIGSTDNTSDGEAVILNNEMQWSDITWWRATSELGVGNDADLVEDT